MPRKIRNKHCVLEPFDDLANKISYLENGTEECAKYTLYGGADTAVELMKDEIKKIPIQENEYGKAPWMDVTKGEMLFGITSSQKRELIEGLGIAPFERDARRMSYETHLGFEGYSTTRWNNPNTPNGFLPLQVLARAVSSGNYFRQKYPFDRYATNTTNINKIHGGFAKGFSDYIKKSKL